MVGGRGRDVSGEERGGQRKLREQRSQIEKRPHTRREKRGSQTKAREADKTKSLRDSSVLARQWWAVDKSLLFFCIEGEI